MAGKAAGWYPDPMGRSSTPVFRWWDGAQWTDATSSTLWAPAPRSAGPYVPPAASPDPSASSSISRFSTPGEIELDERPLFSRPLVLGGIGVAVALVIGVVLTVAFVVPGDGPPQRKAASAGAGPSTSPPQTADRPTGRPTEPPTEPPTSRAPTASPPSMPRAARAETKAGVRAFLAHFVELVDYGNRTRNYRPAKALLGTTVCDVCDEWMSANPETNSNLGKRMSMAKAFPELSEGGATSSTEVDFESSRGTESYWFDVDLVWDGSGWRVTGLA